MLIGGYDWNAYTAQARAQAETAATPPLSWWQQVCQSQQQSQSIAGGTGRAFVESLRSWTIEL